MKKTTFLTFVFVTSIVCFILLFLFMVYNYPSSTNPDWMSNMWGHMGGGMMGGTNDPYLGYFGVLFTVLIAIVVVSVAALIYFIVFPELKIDQTKTRKSKSVDSKKPEAIESIRRTLNEDEKKLLMVLESHNGKYLQKYLGKEAGLTRLKTHRILARFAERGIIALEKKGNTNEVRLKDWLKV